MIRITKRFIFLFLCCYFCKILFAQSNKQIDSLLTVLKTAREDTGKANTLNALSNQFRQIANYSVSKTYADTAHLLSEKLNFKRGIVASYNNIGFIYRVQGNYSEALKNYFAALKINEETGEKQEIARSYSKIGNIYYDQGNFGEALKNYFASLKIKEEIGDKKGIAASFNNIGNIYDDRGNRPEALKNYFAALKIFEETGDKELMSISYNNIGLIYMDQGNYSEALKSHLASLKIKKEIGDVRGIAYSYNNMGLIYISQGNYPDALKNHLASLKISKEAGDQQLIARSYNNIGEVYHLQRKFPEAFKNYSVALKIRKEIGDTEGIAECYIDLGKLDIKLYKLAAAKKYLHNGLFLSRKIEKKDAIMEVYRALMDLDSLQGNFKSAYENYKIYMLYRDSLVNKESAEKIVGLQLQYEFDKKEAITKLEEQKTIEAAKSRSNLIIMISAILIICALLIILLIRQRNLKRRAIEKATAAHKMTELELQSLRTQLNPHFMFNSLNSIQELILLEENEKSQSYLARFGKLLRMLLENAESPFISLRKEIDFLQLYLGLENLRIPDLQYSISTDSTLNAEETLIPNMILQPYIENAICHGLSHKEKDKQLQIRIYCENGTVNYEIEDNGVGRKKAAELKSLFRQKHKSKGMELLTKRFKLLNEEYGSNINTTTTDVIKNNEAAGTLVRIRVPIKLTEHLLN